jgi:putative flippase GtrA
MIARLGERGRRWIVFLIGGGLNTALTWGLYLLLTLALPYQAAYLVTYVLGIAFSYVFNARFVFGAPLSWRAAMAYPSVYVVQYVAGAMLLSALVEYFRLPKAYAPLIVTVVMIPATYVMSKLVLAWAQRRSPPGDGNRG